MDTITKGMRTEIAVLHAFVELGYPVLLPVCGTRAYDLLAEVGPGRFLRVQCKTGQARDGRLQFNTCSTDHGRGPRSYHGLADAFGVRAATGGPVYLVPVGEIAGAYGSLRLAPARNNQRRRVRFAARYELSAWSGARLEALLADVPNLGSLAAVD